MSEDHFGPDKILQRRINFYFLFLNKVLILLISSWCLPDIVNGLVKLTRHVMPILIQFV